MLDKWLPQPRIIQFAFEKAGQIQSGLPPKQFIEKYENILPTISDEDLEMLAQKAAEAVTKEAKKSEFNDINLSYRSFFRSERRRLSRKRITALRSDMVH